MNKFLRLVLASSLLAIGSLVISQFADDLAPQDEGLSTQAIDTCTGLRCDRVSVTKIFVNTNGILYVGTSGIESNLSCTANSQKHLVLSDQAKNYDEIFVVLLSAKLNSIPATINISSVESTCTITSAFI